MAPHPISVGTTGTLTVSAKVTSRSEASALMTPPPATISGRSAALSIASACLDLRARRRGLVDRQRRIGRIVEFDFGELHVERQIDQHRARAPRAHDVKSLAEHPRHQPRLAHGDGPFCHGLCDRLDVDGLKIFLVEPRARRLSGDAEDRNRIRDRRIKPGDHVGAGRTRGADADADIAGPGAGISLRHVRSAFDMPRQDMLDRAAQL